MKRILLVFCLLGLIATRSSAFVRITSSSASSPRWLNQPIPFSVNERGAPQIPNGSEFTAIRQAFNTWQNVPLADLAFADQGMTAARTVARDNVNLITFTDDQTPLGSTTIAATFSFFQVQNNTLITAEADISFNTTFEFSTSGETDKFDIQGVLTHELGHFIGLDHSGLVSSVMVPFSSPGQVDQRTLAYDDMAGAAEIYPRPTLVPATGSITGVVSSSTNAVFGAHVVAVDANGSAVVATLSQPGGRYTIPWLPPGSYRVYAEPLDRPVLEGNVGGSSTSFYRSLNTDFGTTFHGDVAGLNEARTVTVELGGQATADIRVLPRSSPLLNLTGPTFAPRIARGSRGVWRIGGEDITAGVSFSTTSSSVILGPPTFGGRLSSTAPTSATMDLIVPADAPVGPKGFIASRGSAVSITSGAFVVTETRPSSLQIIPATGPSDGGTLVTISGQNFRPGASVRFGGLEAASVQVIDSGTILATAPRNSPGPHHLQVFNADGTSGTLPAGFSYTALPPRILSITPESGPPTTRVRIEGERFDTRAANIDVRFGNTPARIVTATQELLEVIVPFGATTGPVTVGLFGNVATGSVFTVTPVTTSGNTAPTVFNFIDASAAAGGLPLSFINSDDAVASITLPFTFSLFTDTYLTGSRISVSTNGWLSLEAGVAAEFQNASLPGTTTTRPGGSSGVIPPSLIAPFFDDLLLRGTSMVTVRTIGSEPGRQFVIQWTNMAILDENGSETGGTVTFQAVLFEGSNDIHFQYQTLSGSRSDGSSATVGIQDLRRTRAVESAFNQPVLANGRFFTYRFSNGNYTTPRADTTAPTRPVVVDGGAVQRSASELFASWTSDDLESGIREFQFAIGRAPGAADVRGFTGTTNNSAIVTGLTLDTTTTYFFTVRSVNGAGLVSEGTSDGIRVNPAFQPETRYVPAAPHGPGMFSGIAIQSASAATVVLKAFDNNGNYVVGPGIRNPQTLTLAAGQQVARLVTELFGGAAFSGWIEIESSASRTATFVATGSEDLSQLDGLAAQGESSDFVLMRAGTAVLVNPSTRAASVTFTDFGTGIVRTASIPARASLTHRASTATRVRSSEALAAVEQISGPGKLALGVPQAVVDAQSNLVFPHAVIGGGYSSMLRLVNLSSSAQTATVSFGTDTRIVSLGAGSFALTDLASLFGINTNILSTGAVRVAAASGPFGGGSASLLGMLDIENPSALVSVPAARAATSLRFPHVAQGGGFFTGIAMATGASAATITIEVFPPTGATPRSATVSLGSNAQLARTLSELVPAISQQTGGYIAVTSNVPIWALEIYGTANAMAVAPPH